MLRPAGSPTPADAIPFPSDRAFLVQFANGTPDPAGRVEHIASGEVLRFASWALLQEFVERRLAKETP